MKVVVAAFVLSAALLQAEPIGLVLSGGGAKGAYEVGVWKALAEKRRAGDVRVISGTSIGAINGALFASVADPVQIERLWLDRFDDLVDPMVEEARTRLQHGLEVVADGMVLYNRYLEEGKRELAAQRGVPVEDLLPGEIDGLRKKARQRSMLEKAQPLRTMGTLKDGRSRDEIFRRVLGETLPRHWPGHAPRVYVTALAKKERRTKAFLLNGETHIRKLDAIAASSAVPFVFKPVEIDGSAYADGGIGWNSDNTPIRTIATRHPEIGTIVVVYLDNETRLGAGRVRPGDFPGKRIVEIIPSQDTHGIIGSIDSRMEHARRLIDLGYRDACAALGDSPRALP